MKINVLNTVGVTVLSIEFPLLDIEISRGRKVLIRSIAFQNGFVTSTVQRKDANGVGYLEIKMLEDTPKSKISLFARQIVTELL